MVVEAERLIDELLKRRESDDLDFKAAQYDLGSKKGKSKFIKDIVAMANTPGIGDSYILVGVKEQPGRSTEVPGVTEHPDESELGRIVQGVVQPAPRFSYRQVKYGQSDIGLVEIPGGQHGPFLPRKDYGVLRRKGVYVRRNTQNTEADREDLLRIASPRQDEPSNDVGAPTSAWEQLYRACDGFDSRRVYIAVVEREPDLDVHDYAALAGLHWSIIVDFDTATDSGGNYAAAAMPFKERHSLRLAALDEPTPMSRQSTVWIAAAGLQSRPTTDPAANWRDWNRSKVPGLEQCMGELARITEPAPVTVVVFGGEVDYVSTTCEIADRAFARRVEYVFANLDVALYSEVARQFDATSVVITMPDVCQGFRELARDSLPQTEIRFPKLGGGTIAIAPERARWMEEQLELVHWDVGSSTDEQTPGDAFLKGDIVSWYDLHLRVDADREATISLEQRVRRDLEERATRRVNLWHWPGAGATTVARRLAWNMLRQHPTVVALEIEPKETAERLRYLFGETRLPLFVVIDGPAVAKEAVDRLYDALRSSHTPAVLLNVERRFDSSVATGSHYLDAMLTTAEAVRLTDVLANRVPDRRSQIESLIDESDRRKRTPFYFGLVAYGRDFLGLESYVEARLAQAPDPVREALLLTAFAYYYGQVALPLQVFGSVFGIAATKLVTMSKVIPEYVRELLVEDKGRVRPAHQLIAEEIVQQELTRVSVERRNWRIGLADLVTRFIDLLADLPLQNRGTISDILRAVVIERGSAASPAGPWETEFSPLLEDVPSVDGRQRILEYLTEAFPAEPHFWAHLGRFYSRQVQDHSKAHGAHGTAIELLPNDPLLRHMAGMGWRAELYDMLSSLDQHPAADYEDTMFGVISAASKEFDAARTLDRRSEYSYISHVQMLQRVVASVSNSKGYGQDVMRFLTLNGNARYCELVDQAQNLLSDLALVKGGETPSQLHVTVEADVDKLHGRHSEAIQRLTNVLDRGDSFRPPLRRAIIRSYLARRQGDWRKVTGQELVRVVELARDNMVEEPASDYNLRLWLRAVRVENALSVDHVAEQLAYKRLRDPSVDTTFYLYIMKFLQLESGDLAVARELPHLIAECGQLARGLSRTTTSLEWLGAGTGLATIVHFSNLGHWDAGQGFWSEAGQLKTVRGSIARIRDHGSGEIELRSGLRVFFIPSRGAVSGGYIAGQDIGREVAFFLGFSYDGLRAWAVRDP